MIKFQLCIVIITVLNVWYYAGDPCVNMLHECVVAWVNILNASVIIVWKRPVT